MKKITTFEQFMATENAAVKAVATEVAADAIKKKMNEACESLKEAMAGHAKEVDADETEATAKDALKEAMNETAAVVKAVATEVAADQLKKKMSESELNENPALIAALAADKLNENPMVAMAAAEMLKEMKEAYDEKCGQMIQELEELADTEEAGIA